MGQVPKEACMLEYIHGFFITLFMDYVEGLNKLAGYTRQGSSIAEM